MNKVIFIGVHRKIGKKPLDSSTLSGKTIDRVIAQLEGVTCLKTNLFDVTFLPTGEEAIDMKQDFLANHKVSEGDVVVLLGKTVYHYLYGEPLLKNRVVTALHPSLQFAKITREAYIDDLASRIRQQISPSIPATL